MKRYRLCLSVTGFLRNNRFPDDYEGVFKQDDGFEMEPITAYNYLISELAHGRKVIPCSSDCGNPCPNADKGCTGFDYAGGGCPGFEIPADEEVAR
jgi:hypothetical protein